MRTEGAIRHKLGQIIYRLTKKEIERGLRQTTDNCLSRLPIEDTDLVICGHADNLHGTAKACDDACASNCPLFQLARDKQTIKEDVREFLGTSTLAEIAQVAPDAAALMWVLDLEGSRLDSLPEEVVETIESVAESRVVMYPVPTPVIVTAPTLWSRVQHWLRRS